MRKGNDVQIESQGFVDFTIQIPTSKIPPIVANKKRIIKLIIPESSQSSKKEIKQPEPVEVISVQKKKVKKVKFILGPYE